MVTLSGGAAGYTTSRLAVGANSITAVYGGDTSLSGSMSSAVTVTVQTVSPSFTLGASPTSGTVSAGASAQTTLTVTPAGGFSKQVNFACSGPPMGATCSFSPTTVTPNGAAATTTLTIATAAQSSGLAWPYGPDSRSDSRGAWTLALLAGGGSWLFGRRRKNIPWTRFWIEWIEYPVANLFSHRDRNSRIRVADGCLQPDRAVR
jgi:hypothetical protein